MNTNKLPRVFVYCQVTEAENELRTTHSLAAQAGICLSFCKTEGLQIQRFYYDAGTNRRSLQRLLRECESSSGNDFIVTLAPECLADNFNDLYSVLDRLRKANTELLGIAVQVFEDDDWAGVEAIPVPIEQVREGLYGAGFWPSQDNGLALASQQSN